MSNLQGILAAAVALPPLTVLLVGKAELERVGEWEVDGKSGFTASFVFRGQTLKASIDKQESNSLQQFVGKEVVVVGLAKSSGKDLRFAKLLHVVLASDVRPVPLAGEAPPRARPAVA